MLTSSTACDGSEEYGQSRYLLIKSFADGKLEFDAFADAGPFDIQWLG